MIAALGTYLTKKRLVNVTKMALAGHEMPRPVNGTVPDLEGVVSIVGQKVYGAAEECDTYSFVDSRVRLEALSRVSNAAVFLVVPGECFTPAKRYVLANFPDRNITVLPYGKP